MKPEKRPLVTAPGIAGPILLAKDVRESAGPKPVAWSSDDIPEAAIRRAFGTRDPKRRAPILAWALYVDRADPPERAWLDKINAALSDEREALGLAAEPLPEHVPTLWRNFTERPEVAHALRELDVLAKRKDRPLFAQTSPRSRAHAIVQLYEFGFVPKDLDMAPFLAMADAVEELAAPSYEKAGPSLHSSALQHIIDVVGSERPELLAGIRDAISKWDRLRGIDRRKKNAELLAAVGYEPLPSDTVDVSVALKEAELPPEVLVELPSAAAHQSTLRTRLPEIEATVDEPPASSTKVPSSPPPALAPSPAAVSVPPPPLVSVEPAASSEPVLEESASTQAAEPDVETAITAPAVVVPEVAAILDVEPAAAVEADPDADTDVAPAPPPVQELVAPQTLETVHEPGIPRFVIVVLFAAVIAVSLFLILRRGDTDGSPSAPGSATGVISSQQSAPTLSIPTAPIRPSVEPPASSMPTPSATVSTTTTPSSPSAPPSTPTTVTPQPSTPKPSATPSLSAPSVLPAPSTSGSVAPVW